MKQQLPRGFIPAILPRLCFGAIAVFGQSITKAAGPYTESADAAAKEILGIAIDQAADAITEGRKAVQGLRSAARRIRPRVTRLHFEFARRGPYGRCIRSSGMKSSGSQPRRCGMRFSIHRVRKLKWSSGTTSISFGCAFGTTESELMPRCSLKEAGRGTTACVACASAPISLEVSSACGVQWMQVRRSSSPSRRCAPTPKLESLSGRLDDPYGGTHNRSKP